MSELKTSIAIITYNHERYIAACLESALAQGADEIIVVDDGSTDATFRMAKGYERSNVQVISKRNGGPSSALNHALSLTRGDVLFPFSGDDVLLPESVAERCQLLKQSGADIVWSAPVFIDSLGRRLDERPWAGVFHPPRSSNPIDVFVELLFRGNFVNAPSVAITRAAWDRIGHFQNDLWQLQDYEYWLRASALGYRMCVGTSPFVSYRIHDNNLSNANAARLQSELDLVTIGAPTLLCKEDLLQIVFGESFRNFTTALDKPELTALLCLTHPRVSVRMEGVRQLEALLSAPASFGALRDSVGSGLTRWEGPPPSWTGGVY